MRMMSSQVLFQCKGLCKGLRRWILVSLGEAFTTPTRGEGSSGGRERRRVEMTITTVGS